MLDRDFLRYQSDLNQHSVRRRADGVPIITLGSEGCKCNNPQDVNILVRDSQERLSFSVACA
jgi:hypothetical protein